MRRLPALAALTLAIAACAPFARAQQAPAPAAETMDDHADTDHAHMPGMPMPTHGAHAQGHGMTHPHDKPAPHEPAPPLPPHDAHDPAMHHPPHSHTAMPAHAMGPMQGGSPPPGARDPDYSDGVGMGAMHGIGMAMEDDPKLATLRVDQLEAFHGEHANGPQWDIQGGYGNNRDKLWLSTEGQRSGGKLEEADVEMAWQHAVTAFWDTRLGARMDLGGGPHRQWLAFGLQGLAPYWFELEATGYVGAAGRTAVRLRAEYELLFTQRLVLQPELELNAYGKSDPARGLGSGLSDASLGLRLRYEIRRELAPYVGLVWTRRFGGTAAFARTRGDAQLERQWVAGLRFWF